MTIGSDESFVGIFLLVILVLEGLRIAFISGEKEYSIQLLQKSIDILKRNYQVFLFEIGYCVISVIATIFYVCVFAAAVSEESDFSTYAFLVFSYFWILSSLRYAIYMLEASITMSTLKKNNGNVRANIAKCFGPMFGVAALSGLIISLLKVLSLMLMVLSSKKKDKKKQEEKERWIDRILKTVEYISRGSIIYCGIMGLSFFSGVRKWLSEDLGAKFKKYMNKQILTRCVTTYHIIAIVLISAISTIVFKYALKMDEVAWVPGIVAACAMHFVFSIASKPLGIVTETMILHDISMSNSV